MQQLGGRPRQIREKSYVWCSGAYPSKGCGLSSCRTASFESSTVGLRLSVAGLTQSQAVPLHTASV